MLGAAGRGGVPMLLPADDRSAAYRRVPAMDDMNRLTSALGWLVFAAVVPLGTIAAQSATAEYDKLVADWKAEVAANREASKKVQDSPEFKAAREAKDSAKARELMSAVTPPNRKGFGERALKLADQYGGDDGLKFLTYAATNFADKDVAKQVFDRVSAKYAMSPKITELLENGRGLMAAVGPESANELLSKIASENKDDQAKAWALYQQGNMLRTAKATDEQKAKMAELHAAAEKLAKGDLADRLQAPRFEKERLQIGMEVPDIVGEDVDGVPFKLSDYRGKVVVLDFWGFW